MIKKDSLFAKLVVSNIFIIVIITLLISVMSFYISEKLIIDTFVEANSTTLNQTSNNLIGFHNQIVNMSNTISLNKSLKKYLIHPSKNEIDLYQKLHSMKTYYQSFAPLLDYYDITLSTVGVNGISYTTNSDNLISPFEVIKQRYLSQMPTGSPVITYSFEETGITALTKNEPVIIASKILKNISNDTLYGVVFFSINESRFRALYTQTIAPGNTLSILSKEGTILSSSNESLIGQTLPKLYAQIIDMTNENLPYNTIETSNNKFILLARYVPYLDFYIVNTIDKNVVLSSILNIKTFLFVLAFIFVLITIIIIFLISRKFSKPLIEMIEAMAHVSEGHFDKPLCIDGSYEVRILGTTFNTMLAKVDSYIQKLIKEQEERRKAELYALQMQIHPHFLYNTLSSIKYLAWQGHSHQVATTIDALISLLQNTIDKVDECIYIKDEVENLKNYIVIVQTRYGSAIQVSFNVEAPCLDYKVPKLILQPFIENAFFHGFTLAQKGTILISIHQTNTILTCEIVDNGDGMSEEKVRQLTSPNCASMNTHKKHFTGIGIPNVNERIKMLYGDTYGITIISKEGYGTCITLTLPINK